MSYPGAMSEKTADRYERRVRDLEPNETFAVDPWTVALDGEGGYRAWTDANPGTVELRDFTDPLPLVAAMLQQDALLRGPADRRWPIRVEPQSKLWFSLPENDRRAHRRDAGFH